MFEVALYISLAILILGVGFQFFKFRRDGIFFKASPPDTAPFFPFKAVFLNTVLQIKLFKAGKIRWGLHFLLFLGFLYLVFVHALHGVTAPVFWVGYEPTVDPYQFLRNLAGVFVLIGCIGFLARRWLNPGDSHESRLQPGKHLQPGKSVKRKGLFSVLLIGLLVCSGFLLEAAKILSEPVFMEMVEEYSDLDQETDLLDLKLFWEKNYHVVFANSPTHSNGLEGTGPKTNGSENTRLENGRILNEDYCLYCHSNIKSAFLSKTLAKALGPAGQRLNRYRADTLLYGIHYSLCLLLLVCLPFSRLFHLLLIPFAAGRQNLTLDDFQRNGAFLTGASLHACTNCGYCSTVCSVYPNFQITGNQNLLPHWKIEAVKEMIKDSSQVNLWQLHSGNDACTLCHKCTDICPSNIDLQSLWSVLDKKLVAMGYADNSRFLKEISLEEWAENEAGSFRLSPRDQVTSNLADGVDAFENCIQCTICTNVCPIVAHDLNQNDVTPHQVMNLLRLGKKHLAVKTRMVWTCLTCYSCQEHCPQEIRVADILLELRNHGSVGADMLKQTPKTIKADK